MTDVRQPVFAGSFYPADPRELRDEVRRYLGPAPAGPSPAGPSPIVRAIIAPHAGYVYSGPVAGSAYARLRGHEKTIERVVLLGPTHRVAFSGLALSDRTAFATPLGEIELDTEAMSRVESLPQVRVLEEAHAEEHSLEVQLPFLQEVLTTFKLVPIVIGDATPEDVARVLDALWNGPETLIVVSSDLSHYNDWTTAREIDQQTAAVIAALRPVGHGQACGRVSINGLLASARRHSMRVRTLDLRNSGDTAGTRERVVGYGAFAVEA
jgi:AmmeMemoRadiSam system protein B